MSIVLIVCGGRDYTDSKTIYWVLDEVNWRRGGISKILHGGARGADRIAADWAEQKGIATQEFEADWEAHGKKAGPMRNQAMADAGADGCIAFPGGRGTADMAARAKAAGIPVWFPVKGEDTP